MKTKRNFKSMLLGIDYHEGILTLCLAFWCFRWDFNEKTPAEAVAEGNCPVCGKKMAWSIDFMCLVCGKCFGEATDG